MLINNFENCFCGFLISHSLALVFLIQRHKFELFPRGRENSSIWDSWNLLFFLLLISLMLHALSSHLLTYFLSHFFSELTGINVELKGGKQRDKFQAENTHANEERKERKFKWMRKWGVFGFGEIMENFLRNIFFLELKNIFVFNGCSVSQSVCQNTTIFNGKSALKM